MNTNNRYGKIKISFRFYTEQWELIKLMFLEFQPFHIERNFWSQNADELYLYGLSDHFDEIDNGAITPEYDLIINYTSDVTPVFNFQRKGT